MKFILAFNLDDTIEQLEARLTPLRSKLPAPTPDDRAPTFELIWEAER